MLTIDFQDLSTLFHLLQEQGYALIAPTLRDAAIVYDRIKSVTDLPAGWTDTQEAGHYRLEKRADGALFAYNGGPHSWKKVLLPPRQKLWTVQRKDQNIQFEQENTPSEKLALIGVRSCELQAMAIQDTIFIKGNPVDPDYKAQRENLFIVAVNCSTAGGTCFCVSMNTGPKSESGYDLALTEIIDETQHYFVAEAGSEQGQVVLAALPGHESSKAEKTAAESVIEITTRSMGRRLDTTNIKTLLYENLEHPRWNEVGARCLTCGNCTAVCPTCFCTTVEEVTDLTGDQSEHWRRWDSCFTMDFSFIHGEGSVRSSNKARYRQWMTHKLATWHDQFGSSGCVGCGRCITWCPPGIDITEEVKAIREDRS